MRQNDFSDNIRSKEALHLPHVEPRAMVEGIEKPQVDRYNAHLTHTGVCLTVYFEIVEGQRVGRSWRTGASSTAF